MSPPIPLFIPDLSGLKNKRLITSPTFSVGPSAVVTYICVFEAPHAAVVTFNGAVGHEPDINYPYWPQQKSSSKTVTSSASYTP